MLWRAAKWLVDLARPSPRTDIHSGTAGGSRRAGPIARFRERDFTGVIPEILYTEVVEAHWRETTVGERGELVLEGLPFAPGQPVEVLVVSKTSGSAAAGDRSLRGSVLEFREPFDAVASEDWDALP